MIGSALGVDNLTSLTHYKECEIAIVGTSNREHKLLLQILRVR